ncbi:Penicillin binding protein transpeptidase domain protein [Caprobacter fermentans]|uniref:Penicillin binding protein transpeptidase domain protein n=2 Tax=Caproicibacter fermentans TaxID=2576756 RepID=A0A6N8I2T6_9FIRM|nr:Penicillin binding protein transpeptidase domain protein [Caproicibacter fermentans]
MEEKKTTGRGRRIFAGLLIFAVLLAYALRLFNWQIVNGATFLEKADKSSSYRVDMDTTRGEILDSAGNGLAVNRTGYAIVFDKAYLTKETENPTILTLIRLLGSKGEKWADELPIAVNSKGEYEFISGRDKDIATLKSKDFLHVESYATAAQCMQHLIDQYDCGGYSAKDTRDIVSVRYNMTKSGFSVSTPYVFAQDVSKETVQVISENSMRLPGVQAKLTTKREYPDGTLMPQILGTIGSISAEEWKTLQDKDYEYNDRIGKSGIEQAFESALRGKSGEKVVEMTGQGNVASETVTSSPQPGETVYLTIDSRLQKVLNASLAQNIKATREYGKKLCAENYKGSSSGHGEDCVAGGAVILRVSDFAVLAASTFPTYDENEYLTDTNYYSQLLKDKNLPLINRAFNGIFTPGSVVKPYVALTALQEKSITTSTRILGNSVYTRFSDVGLPLGSIGNYGMITANYAIEKSSNSFFYEVGYRTGISALNLYAPRFGLGVKTGIELSESAGVLAGPAEKSASGGSWWDADTVEAAVGQSDNQFTPLQLATYAATIANNGTRLKSHVVDKITNYARSQVISQTKPQTVENIGVDQSYIDYVKAAMRSVAAEGTASSMFRNYGVPLAAKTGTAVLTPHSDNVTFIGFAPYDNPQIAVAVVLEHGATSKYSLTVAKDAFDAYFYGKTVDANGNLVMPSASDAAQKNSSSGSPSSRTSSQG